MKRELIRKKLSNGIRVYLYEDKNLKRFFASYSVGYGSSGYYHKFYYDKKPYHVHPGIAHFIEHYLIEKSKNGNMLLRYADKNYDSNGTTYDNFTSYYFCGIDTEENLNESLKELITMVECPKFTKEDIERVKSAICEEVRKGQDSRFRLMRCNNLHNLHKAWDEVPIANSMLGTVETTKAITLEEVKTCYDAYYNDENKVIIIGGNIDTKKIMATLEKVFSKIPPHPRKLRKYNYGKDTDVRKELDFVYNKAEADTIMTTYKIKNETGIKDKLKLDYYVDMYLKLKFESTTPFVERLIREKKITNQIHHSATFSKEYINITFEYDSFNYEEVLKEIEKELNIKNLSKKEFELIKREYISHDITKRDNIYYVLEGAILNLPFTKKISSINTIRSLDFDEMKDVISKLKFDLKTTTVVTNKKELEDESL